MKAKYAALLLSLCLLSGCVDKARCGLLRDICKRCQDALEAEGDLTTSCISCQEYEGACK